MTKLREKIKFLTIKNGENKKQFFFYILNIFFFENFLLLFKIEQKVSFFVYLIKIHRVAGNKKDKY